jgi:hypothetical protein
LRTAPVIFSPIDKKTLYFAGNVLFKTVTGGKSWDVISPDLSRAEWEIPESVGIYTSDDLKKMPRRGVIYTVAPSFVDVNVIWAGTDDGLIHLTRDGGKTWKNVTPPAITSWSKISLIEAGHYDANTAYAAVNRIRCDDMRPHIFKTTDAGKTWVEIVNGLPADPINAVREDPKRKGLLFAGSERAAYVSFDEGAHWQSLRLNMPATSIRDLVIKDDDIIVGTHGRSFWILDNISSLRQLSQQSGESNSILYKPQTAFRVRWNQNTDTPIPQEEPAGQNPPDGAIIDYYLKNKASEVRIDIIDAKGSVIYSYSSNDKPYLIPPNNVPPYWLRPQQILSAEAGSHRFLWDLHYAPLETPPSYPIAAIYQNTVPDPTSPWVMPGSYTIRLQAEGKTYSQPMVVKMDPRIKTSTADLQKQHDLSLRAYLLRKKNILILDTIQHYRAILKSNLEKTTAALPQALSATDLQLMSLENTAQGSTEPSFQRMNSALASIFNILQDSEMPPTSQLIQASTEAFHSFEGLVKKWETFKKNQLPIVNEQLKTAGLPLLR